MIEPLTENVANSSGSSRIQKLGEVHRRAAALLLQGGTAEQIAEALDVAPGTVAEWKRSPRFKRYFRKLRREAFDESMAILQAASRQAVKVMVDTTQAGDPAHIKEGGRPDLALQAAGMIFNISTKWADGDVTERVEALERKARKRNKD